MKNVLVAAPLILVPDQPKKFHEPGEIPTYTAIYDLEGHQLHTPKGSRVTIEEDDIPGMVNATMTFWIREDRILKTPPKEVPPSHEDALEEAEYIQRSPRTYA